RLSRAGDGVNVLRPSGDCTGSGHSPELIGGRPRLYFSFSPDDKRDGARGYFFDPCALRSLSWRNRAVLVPPAAIYGASGRRSKPFVRPVRRRTYILLVGRAGRNNDCRL